MQWSGAFTSLRGASKQPGRTLGRLSTFPSLIKSPGTVTANGAGAAEAGEADAVYDADDAAVGESSDESCGTPAQRIAPELSLSSLWTNGAATASSSSPTALDGRTNQPPPPQSSAVSTSGALEVTILSAKNDKLNSGWLRIEIEKKKKDHHLRTFQYFKVTSDFVFRSITPKILSVYCVFKIKRGYATTQFIGQLLWMCVGG